MSYIQKFSLKNKIAFVTGGVGLLGKEVVSALAEAGAKVIILDINIRKGLELVERLKASGDDVEFEEFDVTKLDRVEKEIDRLSKKFGKIDVWVNAAYPRTPDWNEKVENLSLDSWQKNIDMQLNSYSWISRQVCLTMKSQRSGSLINFGSIYGVVGNNFTLYEGTGLTSAMAYSAIKGGVVNLTRYLASYFGEYNIRANTICPGGVLDNQSKAFLENYAKQVPLKRMSNPDEIAAAVLFLACDASSYITGSTLMVDGGWTAV